MATQIRNEEMSSIMSVDGFKYGLWTEVVAGFQALPGLVGFWPMSSVQRSTGNVYDLSGQGRTLTYSGNPTFNYTGLVPYASLDGTGDYFTRADETDIDILGTETIYNSSVRGLTLGGWFYFNSLGSRRILISKSNDTTNSSYWLELNSGNGVSFYIGNGVSFYNANSANVIAVNTWYHICGVYIPSTSVSVFLNGVKVTYSTSIPSTLLNSTFPFNIGTYNNTGLLPLSGRASLCFLSANALSNSIINGLYQRSRLLFEV